jgi:hypothetical protein
VKVTAVQQRLLEWLQGLLAEKDVEVVATALDCTRAILIALAPLPHDAEVDLAELTVNTNTAARILSLHAEYVRSIIRQGLLDARKQNGEYQVRLSDLVDFMQTRMRGRERIFRLPPRFPDWKGLPRVRLQGDD